MSTPGGGEYPNWQYAAVGPDTPLLADRFIAARHDGTYYQPTDDLEIEHRRAIVRQHQESDSMGRLTVGDLQRWAELDWLEPHGTYEAGAYLAGKFHEEGQQEFLAETVLLPRSETATPNVDPANSRGELADAAWVLWASASNCGVDLEAALSVRLGQPGPVTLDTVHSVVASGPSWIPQWIGAEPEEFGTVFADTDEMSADLLISDIELQIMIHTNQLYRHGIRAPQDAPAWLQQDVTDRYVDGFLLLAYLAHQWSHSSLPDIAGLAFEKLSARAATSHIDKRRRTES